MCAGHPERNRTQTNLLLPVLAIALAGCGAGEDKKERTEGADKKAGLFQEEAGTMWSDSWVTETADSKELNVSVNALISVPDAEKMSVAEVREFVCDEESKKQVAEGIFGNEVYSYEIEKLPREFQSRQSSHASLLPYDLEDVCPEELKGMDIVSWKGNDKSISNKDPSAEEAKQKAEDFLTKTGFSNMVCRESKALIWEAKPAEGTGNSENRKVQSGYTFSFGLGTGEN